MQGSCSPPSTEHIVCEFLAEIFTENEFAEGQFVSFLQESLRKITHTLAMKNEEISNFICTLKQSLDNLEVPKHTGLELGSLSETVR